MENEHFNSEGGLIIRDRETDLEQFLQIKQLRKSGVEKGTPCEIKFDVDKLSHGIQHCLFNMLMTCLVQLFRAIAIVLVVQDL